MQARFPRTPYTGSPVSEKNPVLGFSVNKLFLAPWYRRGYYVSSLRACTKGDSPVAITVVFTVVFGVLVVFAGCLAALVGLEVVQRLVPAEKRQEHNDVAGFVYAVVGIVYAVLLALLVIAVWEQFQKANETVESEANAVAEIAWLAHRLPEPERHVLQEEAPAPSGATLHQPPLGRRHGLPPAAHDARVPAGDVQARRSRPPRLPRSLPFR